MQSRVRRAVAFIEGRLDDPSLTLDATAAAAGLSKYTLHRLFRACLGETLKGYVRKRRLTEAARRLVHGDQGILEEALRAGFGSQEAFTRAFQGLFGVPPGRYRRDPASRRQPGLFAAEAHTLAHRQAGLTHQPRFTQLEEPLTLRGWGTAADFEDDTPIVTLWEQVLERLGDRAPPMLIGVTQAEHPQVPTGPEDLAYVACVEGDPVAAAAPIEVRVPLGGYAVFEHRGRLEHIIDTVNYAWASWLPGSGYRKSDRPDLERVPTRALTDAEPTMELWVSVEGL